MIRNVVMGTVRADVGDEQIEVALQALRGLAVAGVEFDLVAGTDLGLRPGNASYCLTADFATREDYRTYDLDEEHNRIRRELFAPISERIDRIQFELPS